VASWCRQHGHAGLHVERFHAEAAGPRPGDGPIDVVLQRSGVTARVPADRTILEVAEEHGVSVFNSCREGTCGSCETPVLHGEPDHRDVLLSDAEKRAGDRMLICVSRARTPRLVLDM
jgi:ferredoxin